MEKVEVRLGVGRVLRNHALMAGARQASYSVAIAATEGCLPVWLTTDRPARPRVTARIHGARWWEPGGMEHEAALANRLAAELREQIGPSTPGADDL